MRKLDQAILIAIAQSLKANKSEYKHIAISAIKSESGNEWRQLIPHNSKLNFEEDIRYSSIFIAQLENFIPRKTITTKNIWNSIRFLSSNNYIKTHPIDVFGLKLDDKGIFFVNNNDLIPRDLESKIGF